MHLSIYESRLSRVAETEAPSWHGNKGINSSSEAKAFCVASLAGYFGERCDHEEFGILTLDTKSRPTGFFLVSKGTLDCSLVHPRDVFRPAILQAASRIILVHNHPSGDPTPSSEDYRVTDRLIEIGHLIGIEVIDHIVIGHNWTQ